MNAHTLEESVFRPGWTQYNLHAYRDRYRVRYGSFDVDKDYYVRTKGFAKPTDEREIFHAV